MPRKPKKAAGPPVARKPKRGLAGKLPKGIIAIDTVANLKELRKATKHTQDDLAVAMGVGQGAISRMEKRGDMLVSSLQQYVEGLGGTFQMLATFPNRPPLIVERLGKKASSSPKGAERKAVGAQVHATG